MDGVPIAKEKTMGENDERKGYSDDAAKPMTPLDWLKLLLVVAASGLAVYCVWWVSYLWTHPVMTK